MKKASPLLFALICYTFMTFGQSAQSIYNKAYQQLQDGINVTEILLTLQACMNIDETFEEAYILRAFIFYKLEDYKSAVNDYDALLAIHPEHLEAIKKRAFTKIQLEDYIGALADHTLRISIDPDDGIAYFDRAYCHGLMGSNEKAIADYTRAIERDNQHIPAFKNRGIARINQLVAENERDPSIEEAEFACEDFVRARKLGDTSVSKFLQRYCLIKE